jgi:ACT domain-containing protein
MSRIVVTAFGKDRIGIVSSVTNALAAVGANIEDLTSSKLGENFVMLVVCDMARAKDFQSVKKAVTAAGKRVGVNVVVQREEIFKGMHRI